MENKTDTETLLRTYNMTMQDVYKIIGKGVSTSYLKTSSLRSYTTIDDMTQDVLLYYLSTMKSTGEIRLNYYIKACKSREHFARLLFQAGMQKPYLVVNSKAYRERAYSFEDVFKDIEDCDDYKINTISKYLIDKEKEPNKTMQNKEIVDLIVEKLNTYNFNRLKLKYKDNLSFLMDTKNCLIAYKETLKQLRLIIDKFNGVPILELKEKYGCNPQYEMRKIRNILGEEVENYLRTF